MGRNDPDATKCVKRRIANTLAEAGSGIGMTAAARATSAIDAAPVNSS